MEHVTPDRINDLFDPDRAFDFVAVVLVHLRQICPRCEQGYARWVARRQTLGMPIELAEPIEAAYSPGPFALPAGESEQPLPAEDHLTPERLDGFFRPGTVGGTVLRLVAHLLEHCPTCEAAYVAWDQLRAAACAPPPSATYAEALDRATSTARQAVFQVARERATASERLTELLALPPRQRLAAVRAGREHFSGPRLAEVLIAESRERMPGRPQESFDLACLATAVLRRSEISLHACDLYVLATARIANAVRVRGRLSEAAEMFAIARYLLASAGSADTLVAAELDDLQGSLLRDQRRFEEAEATLRRAERTYRAEERYVEAARVLMKLDGVYFEQGDLPRAVQAARQALALLDPDEEPRLHFYARHNLIDDYCESGFYAQAEELLAENLALLEDAVDPLTQFRILWLEAKIARGLNRLQEAESSLLTTRHGFLHHTMPYDAALVSLELAILYLEQGRTADVRQLAVEMVAVFEEQQIHREATAALILFSDAAELERVSVALVEELVVYLRRARRDPSYEFQDAS